MFLPTGTAQSDKLKLNHSAAFRKTKAIFEDKDSLGVHSLHSCEGTEVCLKCKHCPEAE